ncbi:MAG: SDR family oxidoreductase [Actinobacteria bacterium]|nr:SDR family oxidoreductase [Actinomycetota bacterium]
MPEPPPYPEPRHLLAGKHALVTAAAGTGIGFATAKRMAEEGATIVLSDRHERRLREALEQLNDETDRTHHAVACDVSDRDQVDALFEGAIGALGHLDIVFNNAGLGGRADLVDMTDDEWARVIDVTLTGTFRCTRAALRHLIPRKQGTVINNASVLGWRAQAGQGHYGAAKAGVMALTRAAAIEAAPHGVRVNAVSPSLAIHEHLAKVTGQDLLDELERDAALGRSATPWEVANVVVFLASDLSSYLTGEVLSVSSQHP